MAALHLRCVSILTTLKRLFDFLVMGHVLDVNPAHAVRGPKYVLRKGKTPVLTGEEARRLMDSIVVVAKVAFRNGVVAHGPSIIGLRDRAIITLMTYTFARVNAVLRMRVRDYFIQSGRKWARFHEKGGREHEVPCIIFWSATWTNTSALRISAVYPMTCSLRLLAARPAAPKRCGSRTSTEWFSDAPTLLGSGPTSRIIRSAPLESPSF